MAKAKKSATKSRGEAPIPKVKLRAAAINAVVTEVNTEPPPSQIVTLADLESHLWEAANILRGSPVDRTDWKSYILPLLFFKRICDVWDEEHAAMLAEYGADYADQHRFQVPEKCHWRDVRDRKSVV